MYIYRGVHVSAMFPYMYIYIGCALEVKWVNEVKRASDLHVYGETVEVSPR